MEFSDKSGHIFSLPDYDTMPIGYEYKEQPYVFYIDSERTTRLSVNNYYSDSIYALYELPGNMTAEEVNYKYNVTITLESNVFKLISSTKLQELIEKNQDAHDYISLINDNNYIDFYNDEIKSGKTEISDDDVEVILLKEKSKNTIDEQYTYYMMIPIYVLCSCTEEGTFLSNILIHIENKYDYVDTYCPITIGASFIDEYEPLMINGRNMGIDLPQDILKAIYNTKYDNEVFDEALYNVKMKEYLYNYMNIRGEKGNFASAIDSLKWFGWGDKISISKLLKTDNEFKEQFIRDYFDISYDIIEAYKFFSNSANISLTLELNNETGENYAQEYNKDLNIGEGNPILEDLLEKTAVNNIWCDLEDEKWGYVKSYYDFSINELGLKLVCLKYFYTKYFLPIHLHVHSLTLNHKVYANPIKFISLSNEYINEIVSTISTNNINNNELNYINIENIGNENHLHYFTKQIHYVDENLCEFEHFHTLDDSDNMTVYYLDDTCANIPITFREGYHNVVLILFDKTKNKQLFEKSFAFIEETRNVFKNFIIYPKLLMNLNSIDEQIDWLFDDFILYISDNNSWYEYDFSLSINEMHIEMGRLTYAYSNQFKQLKYDQLLNNILDFNSYMHEPWLVSVNNNEFFNKRSLYYIYNHINDLYKNNILNISVNDLLTYVSDIYSDEEYDENEIDINYINDNFDIVLYKNDGEEYEAYTLNMLKIDDQNVFHIEKTSNEALESILNGEITNKSTDDNKIFDILHYNYEKLYENLYNNISVQINRDVPMNLVELYELSKFEKVLSDNILYFEPNRKMSFNGITFDTMSTSKKEYDHIKTWGSPIKIKYSGINDIYQNTDQDILYKPENTEQSFMASLNPDIYGYSWTRIPDENKDPEHDPIIVLQESSITNENGDEIFINQSYSFLGEKIYRDNPSVLWYDYQNDLIKNDKLYHNDVIKLFSQMIPEPNEEDNVASYEFYRGYRNFILQDLSELPDNTEYEIGILNENGEEETSIQIGYLYEEVPENSSLSNVNIYNGSFTFVKDENNSINKVGRIFMFICFTIDENLEAFENGEKLVYVYIKDKTKKYHEQSYNSKYDASSHKFKIIDENNNEYEYWFGDNTDENTLSLYAELSDIFGNTYEDKYCLETIKNGYNNTSILMDNYIMHDDKSWYLIRISRDVINNYAPIYKDFSAWNKNFLSDEFEDIYYDKESESDEIKYKFHRKASNLRMLINRMKYISNDENRNGSNTYKIEEKDIIVGRIFNNDKLGFNVIASPKWTISGKTYNNIYIKDKKIGNTDMIFFTTDMIDNQKGYYEIAVNYNLEYIPINIKESKKSIICIK